MSMPSNPVGGKRSRLNAAPGILPTAEVTAQIPLNASDIKPSQSQGVFGGYKLFPEILRHVFGFLKLEDMNNCRLVCHEWNDLVKPLQLSLFDLTFTPDEKTLGKFITTFGDPSISESTSIKFKNGIRVNEKLGPIIIPWHVNDLHDFCDYFGRKIKSLVIHQIYVQDKLISRRFDVCNGIQSCLTSLKVDCLGSISKIAVSLDSLVAIKFLYLYNGAILKIGKKGNKITPIDLVLHEVQYIESRKKILHNIHINDIFDFSRTKTLHITGLPKSGQQISLDLRDPLIVKSLILEDVEILHMEEAKWTVTKVVSFTGIFWTQPNKLKFTSLDFKCAPLDLAVLPQNLERLRLNTFMRTVDGPTLKIISKDEQPIVFPELKYLSLTELRDIMHEPLLQHFRKCPKLTDINYWGTLVDAVLRPSAALQQWPHRLPFLDIAEFPPNLRGLGLCHPTKVTGVGFHALETLVVGYSKLGFTFFHLLKKLRPNNLVLHVDPRQNFEYTLRIINDMQKTHPMIVYWGPVLLTDQQVHTYLENAQSLVPLPVADTNNNSPPEKKEYYVRFKNGKVEATRKYQFEEVQSVVSKDRFANPVLLHIPSYIT